MSRSRYGSGRHRQPWIEATCECCEMPVKARRTLPGHPLHVFAHFGQRRRVVRLHDRRTGAGPMSHLMPTHVFTDEAGRPLPGHRVNSALGRIASAAGLGAVNPHKLRHSAASLMLAEGTDVAAVGTVLGHASPAVTMSVYAHALSARKVAATDAIAAAVGDW